MSSSVADVARLLHLDVEAQTHAIVADMQEEPRLVRPLIILFLAP